MSDIFSNIIADSKLFTQKINNLQKSDIKKINVNKTEIKPSFSKSQPLLAKYTKAIIVKAHLVKDGYAIFYKKYHNNSYDDYFYKLLSAKEKKHKEAMSPDNYKSNFTSDGFYYNNKTTRYFDADGIPCMVESCIDKDILIELTANVYEYNQRYGISIKGLSVKVMKNLI